jgi:hypothetical protein
MKRLLVWPPLGIDDYGGTDSAAAYFSWFFGDVADEIIIPIMSEKISQGKSSYSIGSLRNICKIYFSRTWNENIMNNISHILMRSKIPSPLPGNAKCTKMLGSEKVEINEGLPDSPVYFYIGSPDSERQDAYFCVLFTYWIYGGRNDDFISSSRHLMHSCKARLRSDQSVTVFGTGPSITEVDPKNHHFDASVICNTIVKNKEFCKSLDLFAIVASDCHFHFSCSQYSFQFLSDLRYQIQNTNAIYVTFDKFAPFVLDKVPELQGRICGIPTGRKSFGFDFDQDFSVYPGESVVNMFLLPIACYLSSSVRLCGFTGRAPNDSYFWAHASDFQYEELLPTVRATHPGFFLNRDYTNYSDIVGQQLSARAASARELGVRVNSLTTSFYKGLEHNHGGLGER